MVSSAVKKYAALCMVCLCSSLFFLGLYQFNNKYSQNTIQAANGILALSFSFSINGTVLNSLPDRTSKVIGALSGIRLGILS